MIIARAPMRISYVGGGSDYPSFFNTAQGNVVGATINQYVYVYVNELSPIARERIRFSYRETESVDLTADLKHPVLREMLKHLDWKERINIGTFSDLPSGVGLGGSSAFTVALAKLLLRYQGGDPDAYAIAELAVHVERDLLGEPGGRQDQYHAAFGGFRHYAFAKEEIVISEPLLSDESLEYLSDRQILVWVGETRDSSAFAEVTNKAALSNVESILEISNLALQTAESLSATFDLAEQFKILCSAVKTGWDLKKTFTHEMNPNVEKIVNLAFINGAQAAKLCGAGGGGFVLLLCEKENLAELKASLAEFSIVQPEFDTLGTIILHS